MAKECDNSSCTKEDCAGCKEKKENGIPKEECNQFSKIRRVIGIVSGKGGVGKSFMAASLANQLAAKGYRVGIMDADVTGPSIPKMYGLKGAASADENGIRPMVTENGIKIISVNLLLPTEETPVIWRGPVIAGAVKQFWGETLWRDIDYMMVDMPPGTGDVPLTVFQSLPVNGIIVVTSPQELVSMIVAKAVNMAKKMDIPILGLVENMSYLECPDCGKRISVFGESHIDEISAESGIPVLARIPITPTIAEHVDAGTIEYLEEDWMDEAVKVLLTEA